MPLNSSSLELVAFVDDEVVTCSLPAGGAVSIGRDASNAVRLDHPSVSRQHAILHLGPPLRIEDLGSANGTIIRRRISQSPAQKETHRISSTPNQAIELAPGDGLLLGFVSAVVRHASGLRSSLQSKEGRNEGKQEGSPDIVVSDPAMRTLFAQAGRAARGQINVLVLGETGVGKDVLARFIHQASQRAAGPFLGFNCAALPASLLESELFGYEKGAFTGAEKAQPGLFEAAQQGTIFLDEIGELPLSIQVKLLRVLEERGVLRIGARAVRPVDFRLVAATNRNLEAEVEKGTFRQDLYFRLNGFALTLPPLRERVGEIVPLARYFLSQACPKYDRSENLELSAEALALLERYSWPGNIRELRNVIERAIVLVEGNVILPEHLPAKLCGSPRTAEKCIESAHSLVRQRILDALALCAGNQSRAAKLLGISRRTLSDRLDAHGIPRPRKGSE